MALMGISAAVVALAAMTAPAVAQAPNLAGKNVQMIIGFSTGSGFDLWGRVVARHIGQHLPGNPAIVPQNMPGAGGLSAVNLIYNRAPKDGTVMGLIASSAAMGPLTGASGARFDPTRITWLGTPITETYVCIAYSSPQVKVKTFKDLYETELIVGATGPGAGSYYFPKALSALLGMKFKVIGGFPGASNVYLAMERGEVDGICQSLAGVSETRPDWITGKKVAIIFQGGGAPNPELEDVPFVNDLARTPDDRQAIEFLYAGTGIGRPFFAPPDMPPEVVKMMRDAFSATMKDPNFIADAKQQKLDVNPKDGAYLTALIKKIYATPKPIVARIAELIK
jgi:tripartite-type tricarboxylate transporter receptor subunit TctC